ncbi:MAG: TlpA family protein disulfide reductase [Candidatus Limnocylindria bacterium]
MRLAATTIVLAMLLAGCAENGPSAASSDKLDQPIDRPLPALEGELLSGGRLDPALIESADVTVIPFWASWCVPCRREQPLLSRVADRYRDRGVVFVGVDYRDDPAEAAAFVTEFGVGYPSVRDPSARLGAAFGVVGVPTTFVVRGGRLVHLFQGTVSEDRLREVLERELAAAARRSRP